VVPAKAKVATASKVSQTTAHNDNDAESKHEEETVKPASNNPKKRKETADKDDATEVATKKQKSVEASPKQSNTIRLY
jgi:hypothetical protein